ncbi:hypothetical protein ACW9UM_06285 [Marinovum sp. KMM 9989]
MQRKPYQVRYYGTFSVQAPDGQDVTPRGTKAQGLLALVCEASDMRRGRRWLQQKLWSARSQTQAGGSLRQTLTEVRACFAPGILLADRLHVWMEPGTVTTDLDPNSDLRDASRDLLEGLNLKDPAFDAWRRELRLRTRPTIMAHAPGHTGPKHRPMTVRAAMSEIGTSAERLTGQIIADQVARNLEDGLSILRFSAGGKGFQDDGPDIEIRCDLVDDGTGVLALLRAERGGDGQVLFSDHRIVVGSAADILASDTIAGLVYSAALRIVHRLPAMIDLGRPEAAASGFSSLGLRKLVHFNPQAFEDAQDLFRQAHEADGNGVYLALRAFVRMAQLLENAPGDQQAWLAEMGTLSAMALDGARDNGLAIALVALTRIMLDDTPKAAADLAQEALRWNGTSLLVRQTSALAQSALGETETAYALSSSCQRALPDDGFRHLWDLYHTLICISAGRFEEARETAARGGAFAPNFATPRRQLVALCTRAGDIEGARRYLAELKQLEPGFNFDRYRNGRDYPAQNLRSAGLIDPLLQGVLEV